MLLDLNREVRGSRCEVVDDAAHLLNIEQAGTISDLIRRFVQDL